MKKILIATTNVGKHKEIISEFADLPFKFVSLNDLGFEKLEAKENFSTHWENALSKAKFYAKKSGLTTIAEDTGVFVDYLHEQPGIKAKRWAPTAEERNRKMLNALKGVPNNKRTAYYETAGCIYDPRTHEFHIFFGKVNGIIAKSIERTSKNGFGFDPIFYYPPLKKTFSELSILEKNSVSHRGKIISQLKLFLIKNYSFKQLLVPVGLLVRDRKMLLTKRRDLRLKYNNKWEFPGGGVDEGENVVACLKREIKEETGYTIDILDQLPEILTYVINKKRDPYQIHLLVYICKIKSGAYKPSDSETLGHGWFTYNQALKLDLITLNKKCIQSQKNKSILKKYVD